MKHRCMVGLLVAALAWSLGGCDEVQVAGGEDGAEANSPADVSGTSGTGGVSCGADAGSTTPWGGRDSGPKAGGTTDAGSAPDASADIAPPVDAGSPADTGADTSADATQPDAKQPDATQPDATAPDATEPEDTGPKGPPVEGLWSWDGSFQPTDADFPLAGMLDDEYCDGHVMPWGDVSPILPPGKWDWSDTNPDLANWRNFEENIGVFEPLTDDEGRLYGWNLVGNTPQSVEYSGPSTFFEGTPGVDIVNLGPNGSIHSFENGDLGDGPDVLVFDSAWSLDFRTGSTAKGSKWDNDLVIGGCNPETGPSYQYKQATIHTGPGSDLIFARDVMGAAIDAGNGDGGLTAATDPTDGDDVVVLNGNMRDFRVFGGYGDDVAVWYVDEGQESIAFWGPNFFGGGGSGDALWEDQGTDRLVLAVPTDTKIQGQAATPEGTLSVYILDDYEDAIWWDGPVQGDPYALYCVTCGVSPEGRRTMTLEYRSATTPAFTGYFWVTAFEELQVGLGADAKLFRIDDVKGVLIPDATLVPYEPPPFPEEYCE